MKLHVTLYKSDNTYLKYPVTGTLEIMEVTTNNMVNVAAFKPDEYGGPVVVYHPVFSYCEDDDTIASVIAADREACAIKLESLAEQFEKYAAETYHPRIAKSSSVASTYRKAASAIRASNGAK